MSDTPVFPGFEQANTTPIPDVLFDELLDDLKDGELRVLLYIMRRTRGFKKDADAISLSQFREGIKKQDGAVLDKGCGLKGNGTIVKALRSLETKGYIVSKKRQSPLGDAETTVYSIRFLSGGVVRQTYDGSTPNVQGGVVRQTYDGSTPNVQTRNSTTRSNDLLSVITSKESNKTKEGTSPIGSVVCPSSSLLFDAFKEADNAQFPEESPKEKKVSLKEKTEQVKRWIEEEIGRVAWISEFEKVATALSKADATKENIHATVERLKQGWWADKITPSVIAKHFTTRTTEPPSSDVPSANTRYSSASGKPPLKKYNVEELRRKRKEQGVQALSPSENIFLRAHDEDEASA